MTTITQPSVTATLGAVAALDRPVVGAAAVAGSARPSTWQRRKQWIDGYRARLAVTDIVVIAAATSGASLWQLATTAPAVLAADPWALARTPLVTGVFWFLALALFHTREAGIVGSGSTEYRRVASATGLVLGLLAVAFVVFPWQGLRTQVVIALPLGLVALVAARRLWRIWLRAERRRGRQVNRAIVVGRGAAVDRVIRTLDRDDPLGFDIVGTASEDAGASARGSNVAATPEAVARAAREHHAQTVMVASDLADPDFARRLSWQLEGTATELVLVSGVSEVSEPRVSLRHVAGLPVVHVRIRTLDGVRDSVKRLLDVGIAAAALLAIGVILPVIAIAIALDSPGPVFFRQRRVGQDGSEFEIVKFRTMRQNAEAELALLQARNEAAGPLFKLRQDPRITRVGAVLRRYSLDELPQFWNVLRGDMSVVGPRPPLPSEFSSYLGHEFRRLRIKPGITGLWQVSGRSDLSWEESVRLDLHYVENWSVATDLVIICRTAKAMVRPKGAY